MDVENLREAALWAFLHFEALDQANAKIHCAPVRYSPITFRLNRALCAVWAEDQDIVEEMRRVRQHDGLYEEDQGR
jgi:hypothetical protein